MIAIIIFLPKNFYLDQRAMRSPRINLTPRPRTPTQGVLKHTQRVSGLTEQVCKILQAHEDHVSVHLPLKKDICKTCDRV